MTILFILIVNNTVYFFTSRKMYNQSYMCVSHCATKNTKRRYNVVQIKLFKRKKIEEKKSEILSRNITKNDS